MRFNTGETSEELKALYNPEGSSMRRAQLRMLEMVLYIDRICKQNGIEYFIDAGNLLGAVRHKGFIPWDDDFDIMVSQKDFVRLSKLLLEQKSDFVLQCHKTDRGFVRHYHVLRDTKSEYIKDELVHNVRKFRGVQVDIFPYESGVLKKGRRFVTLFVFFNERYLVGRHPVLSEIFYWLPEIFVVPVLRFISLFRGKKKISFGYNAIFTAEWEALKVFPLKDVLYEGVMLPAPANPDYALRQEFGEDYMNLPPKEERNHHNVDEIRFFE